TLRPVAAVLIVSGKDGFETLTIRPREVAAGAREHLVPTRENECRHLGDPFVLTLAVGGLGRILHIDPQRSPRGQDLEPVLGGHEVFPQTKNLERDEPRRSRLLGGAWTNLAADKLLAGHR